MEWERTFQGSADDPDGVKATTGIEPVDRSNRTVEPNIDVLLLLLMIKRRWRS